MEAKTTQAPIAWTAEAPADGWYIIRWPWWSATTIEVANLYTDDDTGERWVSRNGVPDAALSKCKGIEFWPVSVTTAALRALEQEGA